MVIDIEGQNDFMSHVVFTEKKNRKKKAPPLNEDSEIM